MQISKEKELRIWENMNTEQQILTAEEFLILVEKYCLEQIEIL